MCNCCNVLIMEAYFLILHKCRNVCSVHCPYRVAKEITVAAVVYSKPNGGVCVSEVSVCLKTSVPLVMLTQQQLLLL